MSHVGGGMAIAWGQFFAWVGRFGVDWGNCCVGGGEFGLGGGMLGWQNEKRWACVMFWSRNVLVVEHNGNGMKNVGLA